jgi:hypothetical protein
MQRDLFRLPRTPWNSGRIIGPKAPLKPKHVWPIRQQLKTAKRVRDLALFNCAIDAKLRGCDLVKLRVSDVAPGGVLRERSTVIQQKAGRPVLSRSQSRRACHSPSGLSVGASAQTIGSFPAGTTRAGTSAPVNVLGWLTGGWR